MFRKTSLCLLLLAVFALASATQDVATTSSAEDVLPVEAPEAEDEAADLSLPEEDEEEEATTPTEEESSDEPQEDAQEQPEDESEEESSDEPQEDAEEQPEDESEEEVEEGPADEDVRLKDADVSELQEGRRHTRRLGVVLKMLNAIRAKLRREQRGLHLRYRRVRLQANRRVKTLRRKWSARRNFARKMARAASRAHGAYVGAVTARRNTIASAKKHMKRRSNRKENELDMIMKIECMVWKLNGHKRNHKACRRKLARRMRAAEKRSISNKLLGIWSGGCTRHSHRNRGWPQYCLNGQDFPQKGKQHFRVHSNGRIVARSAGTYRFRAAILQYTSSWGSHRLKLFVNGAQRGDFFSTYNHNWNTGTIDTMLNLRRGDVVTLKAHTSGGGNVYAWHSWNKGATHSRMQIMYYGNKTYHSAGCSRSPGRGWGYYCTDRTFKRSPYVKRQGDYKLRIQKSGLYRVNAVAAQYTSGRNQQDSEIYRNKKRISYSHNYKNRWYANSNDVNWYFRKGDTVKVRFYSRNNHRYHSGNRAGAHSRLQLSYEGNSRHPSLSAYCSRSPRKSWRNYCLNRVEVNKMKKFARIQGHKIRVLKSGWYRYNHWAITHTSGYTSQHSRTYINGKVKYYNHDTQASWTRHATDFVWHFKKGDTVWTQHYSPNSYAFHSGNPTGAHSRTQFTLEGF